MPWDEAEARGLVLGICDRYQPAPFSASCAACGGTFLQHHLRGALDALDYFRAGYQPGSQQGGHDDST